MAEVNLTAYLIPINDFCMIEITHTIKPSDNILKAGKNVNTIAASSTEDDREFSINIYPFLTLEKVFYLLRQVT